MLTFNCPYKVLGILCQWNATALNSYISSFLVFFGGNYTVKSLFLLLPLFYISIKFSKVLCRPFSDTSVFTRFVEFPLKFRVLISKHAGLFCKRVDVLYLWVVFFIPNGIDVLFLWVRSFILTDFLLIR